MKKLITLLAIIASIATFAQAPQGFNYQATVRNSSGVLIVNQIVLVKFKVLQNSDTGTIVYSENQTANTDDLGHIALVVGQGTATTGTFSNINWGTGSYYLGIELNTGTGYVAMGTTQLLSVPYALYSNRSGNSQPNLASVLAVNNGANSLQIKNLANPTDAQDAVTKSYSDLQLQTQISNLQQQITNSLIAQYPAGSVFCATGPTQIVPVLNPITGKVWMDRDLGASKVATSITDTNAYGDLYQWGRRADGHQCRNSSTTDVLSSTNQPAHGNFILTPASPHDWISPQNVNLWQGVNGVNNPCPNGYRIPTDVELEAERLSWPTNNQAGAFASPLKFALGGTRNETSGIISGVGDGISLWSSTTTQGYSRLLSINSNPSVTIYIRGFGEAVRCIKN
jgi:hypothetical protein